MRELNNIYYRVISQLLILLKIVFGADWVYAKHVLVMDKWPSGIETNQLLHSIYL